MNESRLLNTVLLEEIGFHLIEKFVMHLQVLAYNFQYMFVVHIIGVKKKILGQTHITASTTSS
jgi:uncharacterized membrane protein